MGYHELLRALEDEVERQIRQIGAGADQTCRRLDVEVHREAAARRDAALAAEARRLQEEAGRAVSRARFDQMRALLADERRLLGEIRQDAERRLRTRNDAALAVRLVEDIVPELGDGPVELRVSPGQEREVAEALADRHPSLARRATVTTVEGLGGGVIAVLDEGRQLLDNSLPSRLDRAWQEMEGELAAALFGDVTHGRRL